ncbi:MAG: methyltransferase domain-containing protein [Saprospiraceae bacterium]
MQSYREYGYKTATPNHAHRYILPVLIRMLGPEKNRCILDIGCGNGSLALALHKLGYLVYGIDASREGITLANQQLPGHFFVQDIQKNNLPEPCAALAFDTVISTEVIEHLYAPRDFLNFCKNVLCGTPGKKQLILSTPYHGYWKNLALAVSDGWDTHFTALWDGGHIKFWSRKTLSSLLRESGFSVSEFRGAGRLPYLWKSMLIKAEINSNG